MATLPCQAFNIKSILGREESTEAFDKPSDSGDIKLILPTKTVDDLSTGIAAFRVSVIMS